MMTPDGKDKQPAAARIRELIEPWLDALTLLYAAVSEKVAGGELYGPDRDVGNRDFRHVQPFMD
ncbi:hypothetical protein [Chitinophaga sp. OAE865]|uniref:hypothetical protein n=1 Tax=Chitinophaga sp. OAE865 TaxID=2817898 RepID=UPI001AEAEAEB